MDAPLRLGLGHALHAVRPALELEHRVGAVALDRERVLAVADVHRLGLPASALGVLDEHPVEIASPQTRLVAAGAALDLHDHALVVVGVALDHRHADRLLELLDPLARAQELVAKLCILALLSEQFLGAADRVLSLAPLGRELGRRLELAVGAPDLGVALAVGDHLGVGHLLAELGKARLDLLDEVFDHRARSLWTVRVVAALEALEAPTAADSAALAPRPVDS